MSSRNHRLPQISTSTDQNRTTPPHNRSGRAKNRATPPHIRASRARICAAHFIIARLGTLFTQAGLEIAQTRAKIARPYRIFGRLHLKIARLRSEVAQSNQSRKRIRHISGCNSIVRTINQPVRSTESTTEFYRLSVGPGQSSPYKQERKQPSKSGVLYPFGISSHLISLGFKVRTCLFPSPSYTSVFCSTFELLTTAYLPIVG